MRQSGIEERAITEVETHFGEWALREERAPLEEIKRPNQVIVGAKEGDFYVIRCNVHKDVGAGIYTALNFGRCGELQYKEDQGPYVPLGLIEGQREGGHLAVTCFLVPSIEYTFTFKVKPNSGPASLKLTTSTELTTIVDGLGVYGLRAWPRLPANTRAVVVAGSEKTTGDGFCQIDLEVDGRSWTARRAAANASLKAAPAGESPIYLSASSKLHAWVASQGGDHTTCSMVAKPEPF